MVGSIVNEEGILVPSSRPELRRGGGLRALVLTYRRPREATLTVRHLVDAEGFAPWEILLVINAEGGLEDPELTASVPVLVLPENRGPAGGFRAGLERLAVDKAVDWVYVCEDDAGQLSLPSPRVGELRLLAEERETNGARVGAIVAYGRTLDRRSGLTRPHIPDHTGPRLQQTDVAAWGSTLVSGRALRSGILPDPAWFFGYEDFDFFLSLSAEGFEVLLDREAAVAVQNDRLHGYDVKRNLEPWRSFYATRNFLELRRRHGHVGWTVTHLVKSARRARLSSTAEGRRAILRGLFHGFRGQLGRDQTSKGL